MDDNNASFDNEGDSRDQGSESKIDTIRDILFGRQIKDYEHRFKQLEQRLASDISALAQSNQQELEKLNSDINTALERQAAQLADESSSRFAAIEAIESTVTSQNLALGQQLESLGADSGRALSQTRDELLEKLEDTKTLLETRLDELMRNLIEEVEALQHDKVSRHQLASLLNQVATQLTPDTD